jgi:ribokinase
VSGGDATRRASGFATSLQLDVLVTLGAAGSLLAQADGRALTAAALALTPVDTTGAGDTYAGVFCAALADGITPQRAMQLASVAAGLACLVPGAQLAQPDRAAIDARIAKEGW